MLYISRYVRRGRFPLYGVVNSETGRERFYDFFTIEKMFFDGQEIQGVERAGGLSCLFTKITPYQAPEWQKPIQLKSALLNGVAVTTYKDIVTGVSWNSSELKRPVFIRLSDFGRSCSDLIFRDAFLWGEGKPVTIILDDKIKFSKSSFSIPAGFVADQGIVVLDLRELKSNRFAKRAYRADVGYQVAKIIDNEKRKEKFERRRTFYAVH